jgi:hypothetical protein
MSCRPTLIGICGLVGATEEFMIETINEIGLPLNRAAKLLVEKWL